jgi:hypothetical protein
MGLGMKPSGRVLAQNVQGHGFEPQHCKKCSYWTITRADEVVEKLDHTLLVRM